MNKQEKALTRLDQMAARLHGLGTELSQIRVEMIATLNPVEDKPTQAQPTHAPVPPPLPVREVSKPVTHTPKPVAQSAPVPVAKPTPKAPKKSLLERLSGLELFVGGKLITFFGIILLVTGIGFFVSYAIEHEWINEVGRTAVGILAGGLLIGTAHYLRKNYRAFSSMLVGGGIATLYFTIGYAFHEYKLFSQLTAFFLMVTVTSFGVFMSAAYNRMELAILALIGGFITPIALKGEANNYIALFSYLLILNSGMALLAYFRNWKALHILSFCFTVLLFGGWVLLESITGTLPKMGAMIFATAFFIVFFVMNIVYNLKHKIRFKWLEYILILSNSFLYFFVGLAIIEQYKHGAFSGLFTGVVAAFHFVFAFVLYRNKNLDKNVIYILIGLILTFITLAAPVQLDGNHITLFWATEAVMLLWFGQRSGINIIKGTSFVVTCCMLLSLLGQWGESLSAIKFFLPGSASIDLKPLFINKDFVASLFAIASVMLTGLLLKREGSDEKVSLFGLQLFKWQQYKRIFPYIIVLVTYLGGYFELKLQLLTRIQLVEFRTLAAGIYNLLFVVGLHTYIARKKASGFGIVTFVLSLLFMVVYCTLIHQSVIVLRNQIVLNELSQAYPFMLHFIGSALVLIVLWLTNRQVGSDKWLEVFKKPFAWVAALVILFVMSSELDHAMVYQLAYDWPGITSVLHNSQKAGYPIVWGLTAFAFIFFGIRAGNIHTRIAALVMLGITLLKIFAVDVWEMTELGRIVSFVSLGILVLVISFTYQKLSRVLFLEPKKEEDPNNELKL